MPVKKDPRGTIPRTVSYTVEDPDGYDYTVLILDGKPVCMSQGEKCAHAEAVTAHLAAGGK
jgi:hypothetical protein